jgi:hypothetical protein
MDEREGMTIARHRGLKVVGTLAALDLAAAHGLVNLQTMFDRLRATTFRSPLANQVPQIQSVDVREAQGPRRLARVFEGATIETIFKLKGAVVKCRLPSHAFFSAAQLHVMPGSRSRSMTNLCASQKRANAELGGSFRAAIPA